MTDTFFQMSGFLYVKPKRKKRGQSTKKRRESDFTWIRRKEEHSLPKKLKGIIRIECGLFAAN